MNELKITYKLYALTIDRDGIKTASEQRFSRITPFYILIYTDKEAPKDAIEIGEAELHRLTAADEQWLTDCNVTILLEETKKHEAEIAADLAKRMEKLEAALKVEKEKAEGSETP